MKKTDPRIAYFSMEIALKSAMPTYSGGLGVLAGDTIKSAADMGVPMVALTLLHRQGYFKQSLDQNGNQIENPDKWNLEDFLKEVPGRVGVIIEGKTVQIRAWRYDVRGHDGFVVPVYLLDTDLEENDLWQRTLTDKLYGGDQYYRLCQEAVLGMGGVKLLKALNCTRIKQYHMNEGHSALLVLELLEEQMHMRGLKKPDAEALKAVHSKCVFTTHTPVAAGHDQFPVEMAVKVVGKDYIAELQDDFCCEHSLNMTYLAMNMSHYINGVAKKHGEVSKDMFTNYTIHSITNGVHAATWSAESFQSLFDRYIPDWRSDNFALRYALSIPREEIWEAHATEKRKLLQYIEQTTGMTLNEKALTLGFARRATAYKRHDLLFWDSEWLKRIAAEAGGLQIIYAGKAHPKDDSGKDIIRHIFQIKKSLGDAVKIVYLENYNMAIAKYLIAGVDIWLNTPEPPLEASGTSGMKAALNGVPSLSILDGWWIEGCIEGVTGWSIGEDARLGDERQDGEKDATSLYQKLSNIVVPIYNQRREHFIDIMRLTISLNGSFFNTQRMVQQYVQKAYFR